MTKWVKLVVRAIAPADKIRSLVSDMRHRHLRQTRRLKTGSRKIIHLRSEGTYLVFLLQLEHAL